MTRRATAPITAAGYAVLAAAFLGGALLVYGPALDGPFVSDDLHYVSNNVFVHELSVANAIDILNPAGVATVAVVNYTPVHLFLHAIAWQFFGTDTTGHHVVNVVFHAIASLLLVALFLRSGVPLAGALFGGAFFLLHPANVEAVAWISQLKSSSALVLSLAALLAYPRRPVAATVLFVLALFAKPTAAYALPVAALLEWTGEGRVRARWLAVWTVGFGLYALAEFATHQRSGAAEATLYAEPFVLLRTVVALTLRYLVMGATSLGISAFHEPEPVRRALDPWWLGALVAAALLGWRVVVVARRRSPELAFWAWAVVSFAPVSQLFPFLYPFADRYLYFILPGLLGGALLAGGEALERLPEFAARRTDRVDVESVRRQAPRVALVVGIALLAVFAVRSHDRARIWRSPALLVADAAANYPHGVSAHLLRARAAAGRYDVDEAVAEIRAAAARGYNRFEQLLGDPGFEAIRGHPKFRRVVSDIAGTWIERQSHRDDLTQLELRILAGAHVVRGEEREAIRMLERALDVGGPVDDQVRRDLADLGAPAPPGDGS